MRAAIEVRNLTKRYRNATINAVDGVSFSIEPGALFALLGPNGAGKTTILSILTTTLTKTSGSVLIAGHDIDREATAVRRAIGVVFQQPSLDLNLTAEENVRLHAILYGLYPFRPAYGMMPLTYQQRITELATVLGIEKELFKPIKMFSGGMRRKLEIIRDLLHHPKILFLDEPTTGLDPLSRKNLWEYLRHIRATEHTTIFLTTHYLEEAENAERVCVINRGRVRALGTPATIKSDLVEEYLLLDAKDRRALRTELVHLAVDFSAQDDTPFRISIGKQSAPQIIQQIRTPLSVLHIHSPTLEEAYLEMISREEVEGGAGTAETAPTAPTRAK